MPYCSYCAAQLEANQPVCSRCGRPTGAAPVGKRRPPSVLLGSILLLIAWAISLLMLVVSLLSHNMLHRLPAVYFLRTGGFSLVWLVLIFFVWQGQAWARIGVALLLAWSIGSLLIGILPLGMRMMNIPSLAVSFLVDALRVAAVVVLFKAESAKEVT
jgi:hypothetical protein